MFTFVKNYRQIFMAGVMNNFNFTPESVDKNPDGYLKADDFRKMPEAENHALQRMLMQGGVSRDSIKEILEDPRKGLSIQQLIDAKILPERRGIVNSTRRAEQAHREEVSNQSRETVGSGQLVWPIPNRQEAMRIQAMIGTKVDGDFGPNSRRALQVFLKNQGLYTGAIDGIIGNGTAAAMNAFNRGVAGRGVTQRTERVSSHPFRTLENFLKRGGNSRNLEGIDRYIDARNTELNSLAEQITNAKQSRNPSAIAQAHAATLSALQGKIPAEMYTALANAQGPVEQTRVLDYVSNSLMGGRNTVEIAQGRETAREYAGELRRLRAKTESVLRSEGLSSQFIAQSNAQVQAAMNHIANATTFSSGRVWFDSGFSVRSKWSNQQLEGFSKGTTEALTINGIQEWEVTETMEDKMRFIENMNLAQLQDIDRQLSQVNNLTVEKLKQLVQEGKVDINITMFIAQNCGNVSYAMHVKDKMPKHHESWGSDRDRPDRPGTNPSEGASTSPGEQGSNDTDSGDRGSTGSWSGGASGRDGGNEWGSGGVLG